MAPCAGQALTLLAGAAQRAHGTAGTGPSAVDIRLATIAAAVGARGAHALMHARITVVLGDAIARISAAFAQRAAEGAGAAAVNIRLVSVDNAIAAST